MNNLIVFFIIVVVCLAIFIVIPIHQNPLNTYYRSDISDPLSPIKDPQVRKAVETDINAILQKYPELPHTEQFKQDLAFIALASPTFFGKKPADMDGSIVDSIIQNILNKHHSYMTKYGNQGDLNRMNALINVASKLKIEPTCVPSKSGFGNDCSYGPAVNTIANLALTILDMHNLEWKNTYGPYVALVIARGSFPDPEPDINTY